MNDAARDISGLALALLFGESFIEILDFGEDESSSVGERDLDRLFMRQKDALHSVNKRVRLRRV
jgi:hypothetical protein